MTDTVSGLIWLKNANCFEALDWAAAHRAAAALAGGQCGLTDGSSADDWRLPSKGEWAATIARGVALGCTGAARPPLTNDAGTACYGDGSMFSGGGTSDLYPETAYCWSSSRDEIYPQVAWVANFLNGVVNTNGLESGASHKWTNANHIRLWPVRGGPH